jgi:hypothetical protein
MQPNERRPLSNAAKLLWHECRDFAIKQKFGVAEWITE